MKKSVFITISVLVVTLAYGQDKPTIGRHLACPAVEFSPYEPKEAKSIYDLPDSIRVKLESHLIGRLGVIFYSKLVFNGGQIVDLEELYRVNSNAKNYKWTPYSYYLCFSLPGNEGFFTALIVLDRFGNVKDEIDLPDLKKDSEKETILTFTSAKKIAEKNKSYDDKTVTSLKYDPKHDLLAWHFYGSNVRSHKDGSSSSTYLIINAHDGTVISKRTIRREKRIPD